MANIVKNFLGYLRLNEDDEYEDFIDDFEDEADEVPSRFSRAASRQAETYYDVSKKRETKPERSFVREEESYKDRAASKPERGSSKIVPLRTAQQSLEVCIMKPSKFEDAQEICDTLLDGRATVVNLEGFDPDDAQRIMDFISGCIYAINGKLHQISRYIFIFCPDNVDISGDDIESMPEMEFGVPTLSREF